MMEEKKSCSTACSGDTKCSGTMSTLIIVVILCTAAQILAQILLATNIAPQFFGMGGSRSEADKISATLKEIQYQQAGGKEVYDMYIELQSLQASKTKQQLQWQITALKQGGDPSKGGDQNTALNQQEAWDAVQTLSQDAIAAIKKDAFIEGSKTAKYTLVEYSDYECPYCVMQYQNGAIKELQKKYGNDINVIFKPMHFVAHPGAEPKGIAALCVGKIAGAEAFVKFSKEIFDGSSPQGPQFPVEKLGDIAAKLKVDATKYKKCVTDKETKSLYDANIQEAMKYQANGTPSTMAINNQTGKMVLIVGAQPLPAFEKSLESIK